MMQGNENGPKPLGVVWVDCPYPVMAVGVARALEGEAQVYIGQEAPAGESPAAMIVAVEGVKGLSENVKRVQEASPDAPVLVFSMRLDLSLAWVACQVGARGFLHGEMSPEQITNAVRAAQRGELAAPRRLLEYLVEGSADSHFLSARQREILKLVEEGLTNAQIAKRLFLAESTVKQHLRAAYKVLGVNNRTEAANFMRNIAESSNIGTEDIAVPHVEA